MAELPQTPDMSHLTPEERRIIEGVLMRQKEEEEQDHEIMRRKQDEVQILEETIRMRSEKHKKAGIELNATCHICLKTKFADGVGHICNYCDIRCCARCGGKVTLRSSKVIWVCILCRKKQELLSKTGQWMTKTGLGAVDSALVRQMQEDLQVGGHQGLADQTRDKRPKLERAHSAAEKENLPLLQRSGNCPLRRQYSQQEQISGRRMSTSDSGVEMSVSPHARTLPTPHVVSSYPVQQTPRHPAVYPDDDPNLYRGELDGLMRQHPPNYQRQRSFQDQDPDIGMTYSQTPIEIGSIRAAVHPSQQHSLHQTQVGRPVQSVSTVSVTQQRSFSSSEEERSTPECASDEPDESEKGKGYYPHAGGPKSMSSGGCRHNRSHNGHHVSEVDMTAVDHNGHHPSREPRKEESTLVRRSFRRCGGDWRTDSRRFTERREKKTVRFDGGTNVGDPQEDEWSWEADRQGSQDSATKDSGIDTSSTFTSSEDSNRGDLPKHPLSWQVSEDGQKIIGHMVLRKSAGSGSCSSILGLKVVGGKLLEDGSMGALIEKVKKGSTADVEGQLRPGDEVIAWNGRSLQGKSFREVYNIIAESRLEPQIELVVERKLSSTTTGMTPAGPGPSTPMASRRIVAQSQWKQKHETISGPPTPHHKGLKKCLLWELYDARREKPSVLVTSPGSPDLHAQGRGRHSRHPTGNANVGGSIQVKLGFDPVGLQLIVTIICAAGLTPKSNGQPRNPYAKVFLLPDKSEKSKRRTKTVANTNDPRWNQSFVYNGVRRSELRKRALEISVWDYARYEANDFLGEAVLELAVCPLDEEPEWHSLTAHGEHRHVRHYQDSDDVMDCHLSPPSTTSRLSDSDTSECDITDCDVSREQRRTADGASISSIGSSSSHYSSPPPERELCIDGEHRSRRDMSPQGRKRAALMISRDQPASIGSSYQTYRKDEIHRGMMGHRSHSAAPMDSSSVRYRGRSQSPTGHRSLSPPEHRSIPFSHAYVHTTRFGSRSATATPTGSPKKRQLPQIPAALKERVAQDFEERARFMRHRNRPSIYRSTGMGGWERHYSGLSDSDLPSIGHDPLSLSHSHAHRLHRPRRGHLSPDKDVLGDLGDSDMESIVSVTSSAFSTQSERPRGSRLMPGAVGLLSRRAKSFEYESISSNIFSDDSLRTARRKLKRNLSLSDAGYGDKIPALDDQSKSYYDSNGDDKVPTSLTSKETNYDFLLDQEHKPFYGYDSELSCGETEIYLSSFEKQEIETDDYQTSYSSRLTDNNDIYNTNDRVNLRNILDKDDTSKKKYIDGSYLNHDSSYIRDISSETTAKIVDNDFRNSIDNIYCSFDEVLSSSKNYDRDILARSSTKIYDVTSMDKLMSKKSVFQSRGAINRSYQEDGYKDRGSWDVDYDEGFIDREQFNYLDEESSALRIGGLARKGDYFNDATKRTVQGKSYAYFNDNDRKLTTSDYISFRPSDDYEYQATSVASICKETYEDEFIPRRRRRKSRRSSKEAGENLRARDMSGVQSSLTESKRPMTLQRTESTPTLHSDEELKRLVADRARHMYRRRRNTSCPESRDLRMYRSRENDDRTFNILLDSDEEFGSMETVVGADYFRRTSNYVADFKANDNVRSSFFYAERDRGSYLDASYDHEDRYQNRSYSRGLVRSGSQRCDARHVSRTRRKSSCPECRELVLSSSELGRSGSLSRKSDDTRRSSLEKHRYRRRNSSCPEARDLEMLEKKQRQQQLHQQQRHPPSQQYQQQRQQQRQREYQYEQQQHQHQQQQPQEQTHQQPQGSSKRNVAISDTLEYYEYSMESESQCSENCGFGPCDPRRPRNRAPRPGNANSSLFDSQTATSDTAKNYHPRIDDHHHQHSPNTKTSPLVNIADVASTFLPPLPPSSSSSARRRSRQKSTYHVDADRRDDDDVRNRRSSSMPESSEYTSQSSSYEKTSSRRQVTDNGHDDKRSQFTRSLSNADVPQDEKDTGSFSDTAIPGLNVEDAARRGRKSSPGSKSGSGSSSGSAVQYQGGLSKKSNSTSQLSATECGGAIIGIGGSAGAVARCAGLTSRKRNSTPSSIQRSEEIMPVYQRFDSKQAGSAADIAGSLNSISSSEGSSWSPSLRMAGDEQLRDFIADFGPGQVVGRQALGARCLGEIQLSLSTTKGYLEVEVIRAKDLKAKQGSKIIPAPYVKLYLVNGKRCIEKAKTTTARKTLDPFYQQVLTFKEDCKGCILQVTVWGDYGRIEGKKVFMGIAQIELKQLELSHIVFGWYKLFDTQSLVSGAPSLALSRRSSVTSLDSFKT
ncbi:hypothetical protein PUN28_001260 [Cardiocondyla obscurior]|uniref:Regulating synaptic membrane exocytosis protein 2 n=1 Tax=Cardiocondyla obscurior TaxID=286306 RepID=A0AAW2H416_9HYME